MTQTVAILTKNRPDAFRRCVESLRANAKLFGKSVRLVVSDDSTSSADNHSVLVESGLPFVHCDREFKARFAQSLATKIPEHRSSVEFALLPDDPIAHGAARNFLLLFLVGEKFIMIDDDMECKFAPIPGSSDDILWIPASSFTAPDGWAYKFAEFIDVDFIAIHQRLLDLVPLTVGGSVGDSGMTNACYLLSSKQFLQHVDSAETLAYALTQRQLLCATARPQVVRWVDCTGMSMGVDASSLLPPFVPVQRGEDSLFGLMLGNCFGKNAAYCNYAMHHTPRRISDLAADMCSITEPLFVSLLIEALIRTNPRSLSDFARALEHVNVESLAANWRFRFAQRIAVSELPEFILTETRKLAASFRAAKPYQAPIGMSVDETNNRIRQFAELLNSWHMIFEAARVCSREVGVANGK